MHIQSDTQQPQSAATHISSRPAQKPGWPPSEPCQNSTLPANFVSRSCRHTTLRCVRPASTLRRQWQRTRAPICHCSIGGIKTTVSGSFVLQASPQCLPRRSGGIALAFFHDVEGRSYFVVGLASAAACRLTYRPRRAMPGLVRRCVAALVACSRFGTALLQHPLGIDPVAFIYDTRNAMTSTPPMNTELGDPMSPSQANIRR